MMKRTLMIASALAMVCMLTACGRASVASTKQGTDGLIYEPIENTGLEYGDSFKGTYVVTGYEGTEPNIVIPDTHNDVYVVGVGEWAFEKSEVQSVILGKYAGFISSRAFTHSSMLKSITFTSNSVTIKDHAFADCGSLESVKITQKDYTLCLEDYVFDQCENLTNLDFSNASTKEYSGCIVSQEAFANCSKLSAVKLPENYSMTDSMGYILPQEEREFKLCDAEIIYK